MFGCHVTIFGYFRQRFKLYLKKYKVQILHGRETFLLNSWNTHQLVKHEKLAQIFNKRLLETGNIPSDWTLTPVISRKEARNSIKIIEDWASWVQ